MTVKKLKPTSLKTKHKTKNPTLFLVKNIMAEFLQLKVFVNAAIKKEISKNKIKDLTLSLVKNIMAEFLELKAFINAALTNEIANLKNELANQKEKLELMEQMNQLRNRFTISQIEVAKLEKTLDLVFKQKAIALEDLRSLTESVNSAKEEVK